MPPRVTVQIETSAHGRMDRLDVDMARPHGVEAPTDEYRGALRDAGVQAFAAGSDRADLHTALEWLAAEHNVRVVRADGGGALNAPLLRAGLVSEVSVPIAS